MKKIMVMILVFCLMFLFTSCKEDNENESLPQANKTQINIEIGQELFNCMLEQNETAEALKQKLPLTLKMSELNGNEKYHYLTEDLPTNLKRIETIHAGDLMLYGSNCIVLFYETFSTTYSYTRIGSINDVTGLKEALGSGDVTVTFSIVPIQNDSEEKPNDTEEPTEGFVYQKEGDSYTITDFTGNVNNLEIPSEYEGLPVTKIQGDYGTGAFARLEFTRVTIPDTITEIGQNSFHNCSKIESILISDNSKLIKIGNNAFSGNSSLKSIYIPKGMVELGDGAFNNCGALQSITVAEDNTAYRSENNHLIERATQTLIRGSNTSVIPSGVKRISKAAFRRAEIEELTIPQTVEFIGNYFIADSTITKINYLGTEEEWSAITKDSLWNYGKEDVQIVFKSQTPIEEEEIKMMYLYINNNKIEVELEKNVAVDALIELLKQGDITYTADDYGGFEKVGSLGHTLPTENTQITTEAGDVILYSGNQIVLFYGSNTWSYTRLGKIKGYSASELSILLGAGKGSIQVRISLS